MLKDLYTGTLPPLDYSQVPLHSHEWDILRSLWLQTHPSSTLSFSVVEDPSLGSQWVISEAFPSSTPLFEMSRSRLTHSRSTSFDSFGLLGLSLVNPQDSRCILTEGVSDFFTASLLCPSLNVLGVTSLGASSRARTVLLSLFDRIIYCSDNDAPGRSAASSLKSLFESFNKSFSIFTPPPEFKDLSEAFLFNLKFQCASN